MNFLQDQHSYDSIVTMFMNFIICQDSDSDWT
jgi:hypothetical protein